MLKRYLYRIYDTIISNNDVEIESLTFDDQSGLRGSIEGRLTFHDNSLLEFSETILWRRGRIEKLRYAYHYQNPAGKLIFRYDNVPHYPNLATHPHHKHIGARVEEAVEADIADILREILQIVYTSG